MQDINKMISAEGLTPCEAAAFLSDLEPWSEDWARRQAEAEGLELTEQHLDALCWLRDQHATCGPAPNARTLLRAMEDSFRFAGGRRYLYDLFPRGPISQGCRLAGLPIPSGNADPSFGSSH
jgi:tRNA 2-thiouridine synthesizing protein E